METIEKHQKELSAQKMEIIYKIGKKLKLFEKWGTKFNSGHEKAANLSLGHFC